MNTISVGKMRDMAQHVLEQLEGYEDDKQIKLVGNTYFLGGCDFIGICGYDGGYVAIESIEENVLDEEEEEQ